MENKEFEFKGVVVNGFLMLFVNLAVLVLSIYMIVDSIILLDSSNGSFGGGTLAFSILALYSKVSLTEVTKPEVEFNSKNLVIRRNVFGTEFNRTR